MSSDEKSTSEEPEKSPSPEDLSSAMDMTLSNTERAQITAFYQKKAEMIAGNRIVFDCSKCLIIFSDLILYRIHMAMHTTPPLASIPLTASLPTFESLATWQCSMCKRQCVDRLDFLCHTIKYEHSLIPHGIVVPPTLPFHCGLPDLSSLCPPTDLLRELTNLVRNSTARQ